MPDVEELTHGDGESVALANARRKAQAALDPTAEELILACDTVVELDGRLYGKPAGAVAARATLQALAGRTHTVTSGLVLRRGECEQAVVSRTEVTFRALDDALVDWYVGTGEWRGRAGGYAIQGAGAALVRAVAGDYENVVGLPLAALLDACPELLGP